MVKNYYFKLKKTQKFKVNKVLIYLKDVKSKNMN